MGTTAIKKTISLPRELAREIEEQARSEGRTVSSVVQEALRRASRDRLKAQLRDLQGYWSRAAKQGGVLSERDLQRYLRE